MSLLRTLLGNRDLTRIELAWAASALGNWAFSILLALYAYREGGTGAVAITLVARMVPSGLAAPYAAMLADRHSRRTILVWSAVARAVVLLGAAVAAGAGAPLGTVLLFAIAFTVANTAQRPAQAALMPIAARTPAELAAANVCWSAIDYAGFLLGSLLAGALVALAGLGAGIACCAAAFGLTALAAAGVTRDVRPPPIAGQPDGFAELAHGLRTVARDPQIRVLESAYAAKCVVEGAFDVLVVVAAIEVFGLGESGAGWLNAAWGVGGVIGGAISLALLSRGRLSAGLVAGLVLAGGAFALAGAIGEPAAAFALLAVVGIGFVLLESAHLTLTQRLASDDVLARVFGVQETIEVLAAGLGSVVAAVLVALLGDRGAMIACGLMLPLVAVLIFRTVAGSEAGARVPELAFGLVRALPMFRPLPVATLETLALRAAECRYDAGDAIVRLGEPGDAFYVIADGEVEVVRRDGGMIRLGCGDAFGEIALLHDVPRTATVSATESVTALMIARDQFLAAVSAHPRTAAVAEETVQERLAALR